MIVIAFLLNIECGFAPLATLLAEWACIHLIMTWDAGCSILDTRCWSERSGDPDLSGILDTGYSMLDIKKGRRSWVQRFRGYGFIFVPGLHLERVSIRKTVSVHRCCICACSGRPAIVCCYAGCTERVQMRCLWTLTRFLSCARE